MKKDKPVSAEAAALRRRAEARLRRRRPGGKGNTPDEADPRRLIHELQVHQIELEMQNEALRQAQDATDAALERYADLYDFAPVGYFTVDGQGTIRQVNLTGSSLLGWSARA